MEGPFRQDNTGGLKDAELEKLNAECALYTHPLLYGSGEYWEAVKEFQAQVARRWRQAKAERDRRIQDKIDALTDSPGMSKATRKRLLRAEKRIQKAGN